MYATTRADAIIPARNPDQHETKIKSRNTTSPDPFHRMPFAYSTSSTTNDKGIRLIPMT
jgi:hypothetical protein